MTGCYAYPVCACQTEVTLLDNHGKLLSLSGCASHMSTSAWHVC